MPELELFRYFKEHQLQRVDFIKGTIDVRIPKANQYCKSDGYALVEDVGSKNEDGYIRVWCGSTTDASVLRKLKMRHRLIYFLYHGYIDESMEIDHVDRVRGNDSILNLRLVTRVENCKNTKSGVKRGTYPVDVIEQTCVLLQNTHYSDLTISKMVGLSRNYVRDIKKRRRQSTASASYTWVHREQ